MILFCKESNGNILKNMDKSLNFVEIFYPNQYKTLKLLNKEAGMIQQILKVSKTD